MKIKENILVLLLMILVKSTPGSDKIASLEKRVQSLEVTLSDFEPIFVALYGLKRHCGTPSVTNGEAQCDDKLESGANCSVNCNPGFKVTPGKDIASCKDDGSWSVVLQCFRIRNCTTPSVKNGDAWCDNKLKPGAKCSVVCDPGYIATPSKDVTSCNYDGSWSIDLQCEIPLVLVSGGTVDNNNNRDSDAELLSFYPSKGCDRNITDMPLAGGSHRSLHNLIYVPPQSVLACNGLTSKNNASCDELDIKNNTWRHHSYLYNDTEMGRYGAQGLRVGQYTIIAGGMLYDGNEHKVSASVRDLSALTKEWKRSTHWVIGYLEKRRAFFCSVKVKEGGFLSIGGLGRDVYTNKKENKVHKDVEYRWVGNAPYLGYLRPIAPLIDDMTYKRAGHGCTAIPVKSTDVDDEFYVLVSGGTGGFGQTAMSHAEIFDWKWNRWRFAPRMKNARFGHALVAVGNKIFAIGGDDRNPNNLLDTIEEYDVEKNSWNIIQTKLKKPKSNFGYTLMPHSIFDGCVVTGPVSYLCEKYEYNC